MCCQHAKSSSGRICIRNEHATADRSIYKFSHSSFSVLNSFMKLRLSRVFLISVYTGFISLYQHGKASSVRSTSAINSVKMSQNRNRSGRQQEKRKNSRADSGRRADSLYGHREAWPTVADSLFQLYISIFLARPTLGRHPIFHTYMATKRRPTKANKNRHLADTPF